MEVCLHTNIIDNTCMECGMYYAKLVGISSGSYSEVKATRIVNKSIMADLDLLGINENVKAKANQIFLKMHANIKKGKKKLLLFYCIFNACVDLEIMEDPFDLADKLEMDTRTIQTALTSFDNPQNEYKPQLINITPLHMVPVFCKKINEQSKIVFDDEEIDYIYKLGERLIEKEPDLLDDSPRKIAGAIIQFHMEVNSTPFNKKELAKIIRLSDVTINNACRKIHEINNR